MSAPAAPQVPRWTSVFHWAGPPALDLAVAEIEHEGKCWLQHRLVTAEGRAGAVAIVVAGQKVLLVLQWRPAVGAACWELPRGFGDPQDADATATATREVLEETGLTAASARLLGEIHPDTGLLASTVAVVEVLVDPAQEADRLPTDGETTASRWVDPAELASLVRGGGLRDGISLAALQLWASNSGASR